MNRSAYEAALEVERRAKERLKPFLRDHADGGTFIDVSPGNPLGMLVQKQWGDYLIAKNSKLISFELKADVNDSNRICIEVWSNLNFPNYPSYLQRGHSLGWSLSTRAMTLGYYWFKTDRLVLIDLFELQCWAFEPAPGGAPNIERWQLDGHGEVKPLFPYYQPLTNQLNRTWMRWVPLPVLERELTHKPIVTSVQQLNLDLGDRPSPFAA
jgi:hypothetical protein